MLFLRENEAVRIMIYLKSLTRFLKLSLEFQMYCITFAAMRNLRLLNVGERYLRCMLSHFRYGNLT